MVLKTKFMLWTINTVNCVLFHHYSYDHKYRNYSSSLFSTSRNRTSSATDSSKGSKPPYVINFQPEIQYDELKRENDKLKKENEQLKHSNEEKIKEIEQLNAMQSQLKTQHEEKLKTTEDHYKQEIQRIKDKLNIHKDKYPNVVDNSNNGFVLAANWPRKQKHYYYCLPHSYYSLFDMRNFLLNTFKPTLYLHT